MSSSARFTFAVSTHVPTSTMNLTTVIQDSLASVDMQSLVVIPKPRSYYVWVYDLSGEKVAVIA